MKGIGFTIADILLIGLYIWTLYHLNKRSKQ